MSKDIILAVDYHQKECVVRRLNTATGEEKVLKGLPTRAIMIRNLLRQARSELAPGAQIVFLMESTTGWPRVKALVEKEGAVFVLANVLEMPLPPKAHRKKTDKVDTGRLMREYLNGSLPTSFQPDPDWRRLRRLTGLREDLVRRQTAVRNWINRYIAHETWAPAPRLNSVRGLGLMRRLAVAGSDALVLALRLDELEEIEARLAPVEEEIGRVYAAWPEAQAVDGIKGIGVVMSVSILSRIGPVERFANAEKLIAYAGLAPGVQRSDRTVRTGHLGGGGTDKSLRFYLVEATVWARKVPRYQGVYERVRRKRGKKIARLVVARCLLRSIFRMLRDRVPFSAEAVA
jgi:transposase